MIKTKTHEKPAQSPIEPERLVNSSWDQIGDFVASLSYEPDFLAIVESQNLKSQSMEYADVLSQYVEASIEQQAELLDEKTTAQLRLVANAPYITHASLKINELNNRRKNGHRLPENEWNEFNNLKQQAVWYNQTLSEYMYSYSDESFSEIAQTIGDQVLDHLPGETQSAISTIEGIVRGARVESATRHLLEDANIPYRTTSIEEDLHGADIVLIHSGNEYPVDIKRSLDQLAENDGGYTQIEESLRLYSIYTDKRGNKSILFFPGFTDEQLGDNLHLGESVTDERKNLIGAQLMLAIMEINK